jgi:hypothetical protein
MSMYGAFAGLFLKGEVSYPRWIQPSSPDVETWNMEYKQLFRSGSTTVPLKIPYNWMHGSNLELYPPSFVKTSSNQC